MVSRTFLDLRFSDGFPHGAPFHVLFVTCVSSLTRCRLRSLPHFSIGLFPIFLLVFKSFLHISGMFFIRGVSCKCVPLGCGSCSRPFDRVLVLLIVFSAGQRCLILVKPACPVFLSLIVTLVLLLRSRHHTQGQLAFSYVIA